MPPAKMEEPWEGGERGFFGSKGRDEMMRPKKWVATRGERVISSLSLLLLLSLAPPPQKKKTHSHVLPPREEPQRRPGANRQRDAAQEEQVAHREQPAVEEEGDAEEGEEDAKGGEADADLCFFFGFCCCNAVKRERKNRRKSERG